VPIEPVEPVEPDEPAVPAVPVEPELPGLPADPLAPVIVLLFRTYNSEPAFHDVPVLKAGVDVDELPTAALTKQMMFSG
jgi:hypothetical protein